MTKNGAINLLKKQIVKLENENVDTEQWSIQTNTFLEKFFGKESSQNIYFDRHYWRLGNAGDDTTIEDKKEGAVTFMNDCIDTIHDIGLYKKKPEGNFISRLSDNWATTIILGIFSGGILIGRMLYKIFECG